MSNPKFSIIVPIYNVEKYLPKCLDSIKKQTYKNYEVILIDDGSPDKCSVICDEFAQNEPRCKVIHQANKGLSGARNVGLENAIGKYVYFLDSDDTIAYDLLEKIEVIFEKYSVDIIGFNALVSESSRQRTLSTGEATRKIENGVEIAKKRIPLSTVPLYCYRREFLKNQGLLFKEKIYYEDVLFTAQVFLKNPKVYYMNETLYFYNKRQASITTSKAKAKNYFDIALICNLLIDESEMIQSENEKVALKNIMKTYLLLSEEVYRMLDENSQKDVLSVRQGLMKNVKNKMKQIGLMNYIIASFPRTLYTVREVRRKYRWRKQR